MAGKEILTKTHRELTSPKSLHVPTHLISKTRSYEEGALDYVFFIDGKKKKKTEAHGDRVARTLPTQ